MKLVKAGLNYSISLDCPRSAISVGFWRLPFYKMVTHILGKRGRVSIVFVKQDGIKRLNKKYRRKNTSTDVLAFPLEKGGEILFSINDIRQKSKIYNLTTNDYLSYLLIHALLHLKGFTHGSKMNVQEKKYCRRLGIKYPF